MTLLTHAEASAYWNERHQRESDLRSGGHMAFDEATIRWTASTAARRPSSTAAASAAGRVTTSRRFPAGAARGSTVLQVMPLDKAARHGWHCAVVAARVDKLAPLRTYLDDAAVVVDGAGPDLRALLRLTGEYNFADLVDPAQRRRIRQLEKELASAQKRLVATNGHLERLRASATYEVGNTIVSVPRGLARVLRRRGSS
jgi:hypothetical protein